MRCYFDEIGLPGKRPAERCGVSHSQVYMARKRNVGVDQGLGDPLACIPAR